MGEALEGRLDVNRKGQSRGDGGQTDEGTSGGGAWNLGCESETVERMDARARQGMDSGGWMELLQTVSPKRGSAGSGYGGCSPIPEPVRPDGGRFIPV